MRSFKYILTYILTALLLVFNIGFVNVTTVYANGNDIEMELKDVDLTKYEELGKTTIIAFSETGFHTSDYTLTVYVYNASKQRLNENTQSNVINMASKFDDKNNVLEYSNFKLKFLSRTSDNSIYKFSIVDETEALEKAFKRQNSLFGKRTYNVVGIQLLKVGDRLAVDYPVNTKYIYSGYEDSGFEHKQEIINSIELDVHYAWYRTQPYKNDGALAYQHQLNSVYFSIPEVYFKDNYTLTGVKAEWYEYKTNPVVVLTNQEKYNGLKNYVGVDIGKYNENILYDLTYGYEPVISDVTTHIYDWGYNVDTTNNSIFNLNPVLVRNHDTVINYLFSTKGQAYSDYKLSTEELTNYIYDYNKSAVNGYLPIKDGNVSADLFESEVDSGRSLGYNCKTIRSEDTFDLLSYKDSNSWWQKYLDYGLLGELLGKVPTQGSIKDVEPIYEIKSSDFQGIEGNLLVDSSFYNELHNYYYSQNDKKTFLFRFANTDYTVANLDGNDGYVFQETVFLDFDIIHLEFSNDDNTIIYPVVSSPIDGIGPGTPKPEFFVDLSWLIYAIIGVSLSVLGIVLYSIFKGEKL